MATLAKYLKEQRLDKELELKACSCDGIEACKIALLQKARENLTPTLSRDGVRRWLHRQRRMLNSRREKQSQVDKYGMEAYEKTISDATKLLNRK